MTMVDPEDVDDTDMTEDEFDARMTAAAASRQANEALTVYEMEPVVRGSTGVILTETIQMAGNVLIKRELEFSGR